MNESTMQFQDIVKSNLVSFQGQVFRRKPRFFSVAIVRDATLGKAFTGSFQTDPGLPFILNRLSADDTADPNGAGATTGMEDWNIQIQDSESQYLWCSGSIGRIQLFGGREFGNAFPIEILLRAQTQVNVTVTNRLVGATAGTASIVFAGFTLLPMAASGSF